MDVAFFLSLPDRPEIHKVYSVALQDMGVPHICGSRRALWRQLLGTAGFTMRVSNMIEWERKGAPVMRVVIFCGETSEVGNWTCRNIMGICMMEIFYGMGIYHGGRYWPQGLSRNFTYSSYKSCAAISDHYPPGLSPTWYSWSNLILLCSLNLQHMVECIMISGRYPPRLSCHLCP